MLAGPANSSILEATRLGLARLALEQSNELTRAFERATAASAQALHVQRVGIWFFSPDGSQLCCASMYEMKENRHSSGAVLSARDYPQYVRALDSRRVVVAHDARTSPETSELTSSYLDVHDISSLLDSPIFRHGEVVGVVCHEHVGPARVWSSRDRDFATSVADLLAVLLEQATRLDVEAALASQRERLARAEKMDALGRFGAGLAHDFNNVLQSIMLRVAALQQTRRADDELCSEMAELMNDAERGSRLVRQLLTYAKADSITPHPVDLIQVVRAATPMLASLLRGAWTLHTHAPDRPLVVYADRGQLEQVLLNLVVNARDAMPAGGAISVRLASDDEHVWLSIQDAGIGMDEQTQRYIFDPFFTTKSQGTGLGLSTVQSILQQNGGSIEVLSVPSGGTTFTVKLPRV
jgi:two-component system, cell cycle sensor histidine kinase and response regulator CckA